jgi:hypothetical protein
MLLIIATLYFLVVATVKQQMIQNCPSQPSPSYRHAAIYKGKRPRVAKAYAVTTDVLMFRAV